MSHKIQVMIILLLCCHITVIAQTICMTEPIASDLCKGPVPSSIMTRSTGTSETYKIKVFFHIIRNTDGTGGQSTQKAHTTFNILNEDFNDNGIFFVWSGLDYIDDTSKYNETNSSIFSVNAHEDCIDIYLFGDDVSTPLGLSSGIGLGSALLVGGTFWKSPNPSLVTSRVISHEMGHVLGLYHTHHGTFNEGGNDNWCAELVDGSNSDVCGDYIEDTPADPHLWFNVDPVTYVWNSSGTDTNGDSYNPDVRLIMSYTDIRCMTYFSPKQVEKMKYIISNSPHLLKTIAMSITGNTVISDSATYCITNLPAGCSVTWSLDNTHSGVTLSSVLSDSTQCSIVRQANTTFSDTLRAVISYQGDSILAVKKFVRSTMPFMGAIYNQPATFQHPFVHGVISATTLGQICYVYGDDLVTLFSQSFQGLSIIPVTPVQYIQTLGKINDTTIQLSIASNSNYPLIFRVTSEDGVEDFLFNFDLMSGHNGYYLSLHSQDDGYVLSMEKEIDGSEMRAASEMRATDKEVPSWDYVVTNVKAGRIQQKGTVTNQSVPLVTSHWEKGLYVVTATIEGKSYSEKILVK